MADSSFLHSAFQNCPAKAGQAGVTLAVLDDPLQIGLVQLFKAFPDLAVVLVGDDGLGEPGTLALRFLLKLLTNLPRSTPLGLGFLPLLR